MRSQFEKNHQNDHQYQAETSTEVVERRPNVETASTKKKNQIVKSITKPSKIYHAGTTN